LKNLGLGRNITDNQQEKDALFFRIYRLVVYYFKTEIKYLEPEIP